MGEIELVHSPQKFCKNCAHHQGEFLGFGQFAKCKRSDPDQRYYKVTGKRRHLELSYCSTMRGRYGDCGPEAKLFTPRTTLWQILMMRGR